MAQPFPAHQVGMAHHPGLAPGHPMAPGQHPNAAHLAAQPPGAGMVQPLHPGVSAPGGPQGTQATPMAGAMPQVVGTTGPGGPGPSAHALSHLGPTHSHQMFQHPQLAQSSCLWLLDDHANNPQLLQQQHQLQHQQFLRQRQQQIILQQQQQQQQQQQHGGMPVSLPNGTPAVSAAHMAAVQASNPNMRPVNIPPHIQQQMQAQGQHAQSQALQQQQQHQQQQHLFAMHMAAQQANNAAQQGQQPPQRPGAQTQSMHENQTVAAHPQLPPTTQGSNPPPQHQPNQPQLPASSQPPQQPPQTQAQQGQNAQTQPTAQPSQQSQISAQEAQLRAQQHGAGSAVMIPPRMPKRSFTFRLLSFAEQLSAYSNRNPAQGLAYWQTFVEQFYSPVGVLRQGVWNAQRGSKQFEISTPALARYYWTQFNSGIRQIQMIVEAAVDKDLPTGGQVVESPRTFFLYWFDNGCQLVSRGAIKVYFNAHGQIDVLDIGINGHTEYVPRNLLQLPGSPDQKQSPKVGKALNKRLQQKPMVPPSISLPASMVTDDGVPVAVMRFLEVAEIISQMQHLFQFSLQNPHLSPPEALRQLVATYPSQQNTIQMNFSQGHPSQGLIQRTPSLNGPNQFASPALGHLGIPGVQGSPHLGGSAHTPSPAQNHMAGPVAMTAQQSHQGTNTSGSQGTSANTSPNVSNKRRRASTIKMEADENGTAAEINGASINTAKVKASPRVGGKRQKGTS
ncbi:hypothetical protein PRK78_002667 [Emydomyces testavorans]|uniref:PtaB protein n=1 Tax=Emydomyces testavorans TaxID=2070801 RepID=A0AAF0IGQ9_9EURO|nr:hypothetical protein PRK78_002667 [Emydomyces testavorans]